MKTLFQKLKFWLTHRRECSWCHGFMLSNPFARNKTHGICKSCGKKFLETI